jgi:hypothetical protein
MGKVTIIRGQGGLNRPLPGTDHISALLFYSPTLPAGFGVNDRIKRVVDLEGAEALDITNGAADNIAIKIMHYHIAEFFRLAPGATLYIGIYAIPAGVHTFSEVTLMINFAEGAIKQFGIWTNKAFLLADITVLQGICNTAEAQNKPIVAILTEDTAAVTPASLADLRALVAPNVGVTAGQDGGNVGAALYTSAGYSIGITGAALGVTAIAKVNESIGWVEKFPLNNGTNELDVPAFGNGSLAKTLTDSVIDDVDTKGWLQLYKYGTAGTYIFGSPAAVALTSDYAYLELTRTMNKAQRGVRFYLIPAINGPVLKDAETGFLDADAVTHLEQQAGKALEQMEKDGELSGYAVVIDPEQDLTATDTLYVVIKNVPVGVSRKFNVKMGFTSAL